MIVDLIFIIVNSVLSGIITVINSIGFIIPTSVSTQITNLFAYTRYGQNFFPVDQLMLAISFLFFIIYTKFLLRYLILPLINVIPMINFKIPFRS